MKLLTIALSLFISCLANAQSNTNCESLHSGIFYHYSNSGVLAYIREGSIQEEVNLQSGDTSVWKVEWKSNCRYRLTYLHGQGPLAQIAKAVKTKFAVDVEIVESTADYYVYKTTENVKTHSVATIDTLWLKEQPSKSGQRIIADALFPGGIEEWGKYLSEELNKHVDALGKSRKEGVCVVQFVIEADGSVSHVRALNKQGTRIAHYAVEAINNSPKWIPAIVNGQPKRIVKLQPVSLVLIEETN
jgi:hypothetical protein